MKRIPNLNRFRDNTGAPVGGDGDDRGVILRFNPNTLLLGIYSESTLKRAVFQGLFRSYGISDVKELSRFICPDRLVQALSLIEKPITTASSFESDCETALSEDLLNPYSRRSDFDAGQCMIGDGYIYAADELNELIKRGQIISPCTRYPLDSRLIFTHPLMPRLRTILSSEKILDLDQVFRNFKLPFPFSIGHRTPNGNRKRMESARAIICDEAHQNISSLLYWVLILTIAMSCGHLVWHRDFSNPPFFLIKMIGVSAGKFWVRPGLSMYTLFLEFCNFFTSCLSTNRSNDNEAPPLLTAFFLEFLRVAMHADFSDGFGLSQLFFLELDSACSYLRLFSGLSLALYMPTMQHHKWIYPALSTCIMGGLTGYHKSLVQPASLAMVDSLVEMPWYWVFSWYMMDLMPQIFTHYSEGSLFFKKLVFALYLSYSLEDDALSLLISTLGLMVAFSIPEMITFHQDNRDLQPRSKPSITTLGLFQTPKGDLELKAMEPTAAGWQAKPHRL